MKATSRARIRYLFSEMPISHPRNFSRMEFIISLKITRFLHGAQRCIIRMHSCKLSDLLWHETSMHMRVSRADIPRWLRRDSCRFFRYLAPVLLLSLATSLTDFWISHHFMLLTWHDGQQSVCPSRNSSVAIEDVGIGW